MVQEDLLIVNVMNVKLTINQIQIKESVKLNVILHVNQINVIHRELVLIVLMVLELKMKYANCVMMLTVKIVLMIGCHVKGAEKVTPGNQSKLDKKVKK